MDTFENTLWNRVTTFSFQADEFVIETEGRLPFNAQKATYTVPYDSLPSHLGDGMEMRQWLRGTFISGGLLSMAASLIATLLYTTAQDDGELHVAKQIIFGTSIAWAVVVAAGILAITTAYAQINLGVVKFYGDTKRFLEAYRKAKLEFTARKVKALAQGGAQKALDYLCELEKTGGISLTEYEKYAAELKSRESKIDLPAKN